MSETHVQPAEASQRAIRSDFFETKTERVMVKHRLGLAAAGMGVWLGSKHIHHTASAKGMDEYAEGVRFT